MFYLECLSDSENGYTSFTTATLIDTEDRSVALNAMVHYADRQSNLPDEASWQVDQNNVDKCWRVVAVLEEGDHKHKAILEGYTYRFRLVEVSEGSLEFNESRIY